MLPITNDEIAEELGVPNTDEYKHLISDYRFLYAQYSNEKKYRICLKDEPVRVADIGRIIHETDNLIVIQN